LGGEETMTEELTPEMGGLARSATRLVNDVLNLAITYRMPAQALQVAEKVYEDEMAGAVFLASVGFAVVEAWGLTGRTGFKVDPNHGWPENSPRLAACRIIVLAQNQDHSMLHAMSAVAARQPSEWRQALLCALIGSVADARRKSA
jgi:hypothetical protein